MKVDRDVRIKCEKLRQKRRYADHTKGKWCRQAYLAARHRRMRDDLVFGGLALRKNMRCAVVKLPPSFRHSEAACCAIEQARSEFLFDPADGL